MSSPSTVAAPSTMHKRRIRTARTTGLFYLALGITGGFGFLLVRPALFAPGAPAETLAHLIQHEQLARIGIALEMGLVVTQALAALWFYRLFRPVDDFAAGSIAVFGLVNAIAVLVSSAMLATALQVALHPIGAAGDAQLMYLVSSNLWSSGNLFFGLWLIPMGWCVLRSRWMPLPLGWILIVGGVGYVLTPFVAQIAPDAGLVAGLLPVLATVGELWMIGYLLVRGVNVRAA
jgi:Domain of unknown function (DUF4386)